jgi:hypothetical protein
MSGDPIRWYRSRAPLAPDAAPPPSLSRSIRNWLHDRLPEPDVRDRTLVLYARQGFRRLSAWAGMFSEFHSVLGALAYAEANGAAGVRVDFRSPLYVDRDHGPNWWTYFFVRAHMPLRATAADPAELHLNGVLAKFGRHGGFCDVVNGRTPYLYPMTYGVSRSELHRLLETHIEVRPEIRDEINRIVAASFDRDAFVVGVHFRGTDSTHGLGGALVDYRTTPVPYAAYATEVRRALESASPRRYQVAVATDELEFLAFMRDEFGDRVFAVEDAPRVHAGTTAIHFDRTLGVSNYQKGKSGLVDCLLLSATNYLVKGRSNLSDASLAFNPRLPYSFCVH